MIYAIFKECGLSVFLKPEISTHFYSVVFCKLFCVSVWSLNISDVYWITKE